MSGLADAKRLLAEAIGADSGAVPEGARVGEFERWDSLAHLRLILGLEKRIGRELDPDEAVRIESLEDLAGLLAGRQ
jgi:acyl carrier protein